jgi:predicted Zn-dependent protease
MSSFRHPFGMSLLALFCAISAFAQQPVAATQSSPCAVPSFSKVVNEPNIFNEQQEDWLGTILDEQVLKQYNIVEDPERDYLQKMGERMLAQLPPTSRHYEFYIIDYPINNAFSLGGSKIYVTRQLIAFLQNEDELAGLLGHEIGHVVTHQIAIDVTRMFRKALNVTQVGDRNDIFQKWNQFQDNWAKKHASWGDFEREEDEQQIADRIGLFAMMRAGYRPSHLADFFDRLTENKGKTGSFLTDFFGTTNPNSKRVRLLINKAAPLLPQCVSSLSASSANHFLDWQKAVIGARRASAREKIGGVVRKTTLQPPLRGSLEYLQFSPDGQFLLAQDESSVFVLSRQPLSTLFRIDAVNAQWAQFSPDSHSVVVADAELRVQKWDIGSRQRTSITAVTLPGRCLEYTLSSTGEVLACMKRRKDDLELDLIDVAGNNIFFSKGFNWPVEVFTMTVLDERRTFRFRGTARFHMQFSPDSHYFLGGTSDNAVGYDLLAKREVSISGRIRQMASSNFTFTPNNDLAAYNPEKPSRSQVVRFPSGDLVLEFPLGINSFKLEGRLIAPAKGNYILVSPAAMHPIAAIDLEAKKLAVGYKSPGMAIYGDLVAGEQLGGKVALFSLAGQKQLGGTQLPLSYLPSLRASGFSPDGKWLAAAGETSGGIWNAETGERVLDTGTFAGGYFDEGKILATFHKSESRPKMMSLDPVGKTQQELYNIGSDAPVKKNKEEEREVIWQAGDLVFSAMPPVKNHTTIAAHDARDYKVRWTREFPGVLPTMAYSRAGKSLTAVFQFFQGAKDESKLDPDLKQKYAALPNKDDVILIEVLDPASGRTRGSIFVDTANYSFLGNAATSAGDTVLLYDTHNRTLVYSLSSGQQKGKVLGRFRAISAPGDQVLLENGAGEAQLYSTSTLQLLEHYTFPARITHAEFLASGKLLVLAADQTLYEISVPAETQTTGNR